MRLTAIMITAAILATVLPCNARSPQVPDGSIKLNTISGIPVVDGVFLNGNGPYRFLLDTGAETNQVDLSLARKLGLTSAFQIDMVTNAGTIHVPGGRVAEVSLGSAVASDQEFLFTTLDGAHSLSPDIKGVLGQQFFSHFDYLLDFARHRLEFGDQPFDGGDRLALETVNRCPVIETSAGRLTLDSGTNVTLIYRSSASATAGANGPTIRTASGTASVSPIEDLSLRIAGRAYHPANAAVSVRNALLGDDGILSASLFHAVYVSNSGRYLVINPVAGSAR